MTLRRPSFVLWLFALSVGSSMAQAPRPRAAPARPVSETLRTVDGHPDLQGFWENSTLTPVERPPALGDRAFFTEAEAADFESPARVVERLQARNGDEEPATTGEANGVWRALRGLGRDRRASIIVDPTNGRLPALSPQATRRRHTLSMNHRQHLADNPEDLSLSERCLLWGADPPLIPVPDNNILQIVQTPVAVMILTEMIHDARVIPLDGRPHLPANVRQWKGDSRGRWEGDTLVVDSTNFIDKSATFTDKTAFQGNGDGLHVIERFTRTDEETLRYEFRIEDAATFAQPWAGVLTMSRTPGPIYEYACHEGNYSIIGVLRGARAMAR